MPARVDRRTGNFSQARCQYFVAQSWAINRTTRKDYKVSVHDTLRQFNQPLNHRLQWNPRDIFIDHLVLNLGKHYFCRQIFQFAVFVSKHASHLIPLFSIFLFAILNGCQQLLVFDLIIHSARCRAHNSTFKNKSRQRGNWGRKLSWKVGKNLLPVSYKRISVTQARAYLLLQFVNSNICTFMSSL